MPVVELFRQRCNTEQTLKGAVAPKRPLVPGLPVTLISRCFIGAEETSLSNTLCLELRLSRAPRRATVTCFRGFLLSEK